MDGSICFGSNFDTGRVGAIVSGASLTTKFPLGFIGGLTTGATGVEGLTGEEGEMTELELGVKFDPSLNPFNSFWFDKIWFNLFIEPWRLLALDIDVCRVSSRIAMVELGWKRLVMLPWTEPTDLGPDATELPLRPLASMISSYLSAPMSGFSAPLMVLLQELCLLCLCRVVALLLRAPFEAANFGEVSGTGLTTRTERSYF